MGFRTQTLLTLLQNLDRRTNATEDELGDGGNIIRDTMTPIAERLTTSDTVTVAYFVPSTFVWGNGNLTASSSTFVSFTNVTA